MTDEYVDDFYVGRIKSDFSAANNTNKLTKFFTDYNFLTTSDLSQVLNLSARVIRSKKKKCGIVKEVNAPVPVYIRTTVPLSTDKWRTKEWWLKNYPKYGSRVIANAIGINISTVRWYIKKYHGKLVSNVEGTKSKHPCCSEEWVVKHYVTENMSIAKCAVLAGVSRDTFKGWLNRFKVPVRVALNGPTVGKVLSV
jgi:transposase-like protein